VVCPELAVTEPTNPNAVGGRDRHHADDADDAVTMPTNTAETIGILDDGNMCKINDGQQLTRSEPRSKLGRSCRCSAQYRGILTAPNPRVAMFPQRGATQERVAAPQPSQRYVGTEKLASIFRCSVCSKQAEHQPSRTSSPALSTRSATFPAMSA